MATTLPHLEIVDKVRQLPVVESVLDFAQSRYSAVKNYSDLSKMTFDRAESTVLTVLGTVAPVIVRFEDKIHYADALAVRSLDTVTTSITTLTETSREITTQTITTITQTRTRLNSMKNETLEKAQAVLAVPANFIPLVNNIFSAANYVLDYILPPPEGVKTIPAPGNMPEDSDAPAATADYSVLFQTLIARMKQFTERVHERLVVYSREKWFPGLLNSVGSFKGNVENSVSGAKNFLNGHSTTGNAAKTNGQVPVQNQVTEKQTVQKPQQQKKNKAQKKPSTPVPAEETDRAATAAPATANGDVKHDESQL